ncbi:MAG: adenylate/guanylate cyclase domain-containing protein [Spirochaetales bacterium]|jgi:adenylate cyclase|nr:adenylate/guanylate cyclase domain-containing protein [Spirochaetales bacterium]
MRDWKTGHKVLLFTDLHHYSTVSVTLGKQAVDYLQDYYELTGDLVVAVGGSIVKYIGDAVFAVFEIGSEVPAVKAGLSLRSGMIKVAEKYGVAEVTDTEIGIGSGEVIYGTIGHKSFSAIDYFGEPVMETAMIMHHRGVAVTRPVYDAAKNDLQFRRLDDISLKWRESPLETWEVLG